MTSSTSRGLRGVVAGVLAAVAIAACGGSDRATSVTAAATTTEAADATAGRTTYPVTVTDCDGRTTTYERAPERVVTIDPSVTEMLLTLGLKDRIVGYTEFFAPDQQWATTKADMASLHMVNDGANYPSQEAVVALNPDLVTSVYSYAFADPLPDRAGWDALGVHSYEALGGCLTGHPKDFAVLYDDVRNLGVIFDVQDRAEAEVAKLEAKVGELQAKVAGRSPVRIAPYDGYDQQPTYYGGMEAPVLALAGTDYIWADLDTAALPTWEQFVAADPEVIWIVPDAGATVADLEQRLESDPRFTNVTAVKHKAYIVVPQSEATIESPRVVDGLAAVIDGLLALPS